jgi:riboflavin kinase/FMN adenylyltransferase
MNIGNRPTLNGDNQTIEVHFLNFNQDLYDENIEIVFIKYIREEVKFNSLEDLKTQISKDQSFAIDFISTL